MTKSPNYTELHDAGELGRRVDRALAMLEECELCPRRCGVNRLEGETGWCGAGRHAHVASFGPHYGEESVLVGRGGSGAIFFSGCNLGCIFCQNAGISRDPEAGPEASSEDLAGVMLDLQRQGCGNINFVTPSHVVPQILEALPVAVDHGLSLPLVFNSSAYDAVETLKLLDGVVDIYMPDVKMWDEALSKRLLQAADYPECARNAVAEMHRQTGDLVVENGRARRGLLVRHLVMPLGAAGSAQWAQWLARLSMRTWVNVMGQYHPCLDAHGHPETSRMVSESELCAAFEAMREAGLHRFEGREAFERRCT
ncbi:radical SAM protein [Salidesulfovibrio brasiliensis]